jgi:hypothetical protein
MPPRERLSHDDFEVGGVGRMRVVRILTPLDQLLARAQISPLQYEALRLLHKHWFLGHLAPALRAIDPERTYGAGAELGLEALYHQASYYQGMDSLREPHQQYVVTTLVLGEFGLNSAGALLGYRSPFRGRVKALELLRSAANRLIEIWRI